jgi:crotonobetainyl-CoA:carnitine CoA-transferase CaiB-like acyl-CoA transferase
VDVALLMAALLVQNNSFVRVAGADGPVHAATLQALAAARGAGRPHAEQAAALPTTRTPGMVGIYYRTYTTRDATDRGRLRQSGPAARFAAAIGIEDSAQGRPLTDREAADRHYAPLRRQAEDILASRTTAEWKAIFDARGIPAAGVKFAVEILDDPQAVANGFVHDLAQPAVGPIRVLAPPLRLSGDGFAPAPAHRGLRQREPGDPRRPRVRRRRGRPLAEQRRFVRDGNPVSVQQSRP